MDLVSQILSIQMKVATIIAGHQEDLHHCIPPSVEWPCERFNRTLLDMLSMAVREDEQGWDLLPTLLLAHRTSHHATTKSTPFELMFGHDSRLPEDVLFSIPGAVEDPSQYAEVLKNRMQQAHAQILQYMVLQQQRQEYYDKGVRGS